ncbi:MAG: prepilin-type N-terminal cleavage/methylation domain-containing protein [Candidatus Paceibacterota bacterium]|jgi:prepilin-type N-terminal cleavage/methylation domain-containing protein
MSVYLLQLERERAKIRSHVARFDAHVHEKQGGGFTFIELLISITIIGIFSTIVLGTINSARLKGRDSAIKEQFHSVRTQVSLYQIDNGNYGTANNTGGGASCSASGSVFVSTKIAELLASVQNASGGSAICASDRSKWVASVPLATDATKSWCTDSAGFAGQGYADTTSTAIKCVATDPGGGGDTTDSDGDGLTNTAETTIHNTNPNLSDTDGDNLSDGAEVNTYHTDPTLMDTDGDGFYDGVEVLTFGTDPLDPNSYPQGDPPFGSDNYSSNN